MMSAATPTPLHLVLLAGGRGLRAGGTDGVPKQFRATPQGALFAVSLKSFLFPGDSDEPRPWRLASLTVTAPADWHDQVAGAVAQLLAAPSRAAGALPFRLATPGETRTASTWQAIRVLTDRIGPAPDDLVAVHDAARPFATFGLLDALARAALTSGAAVPGVPVPDTIIRSDAAGATYLERSSLVAVQTPQVFRWEPFTAAHAWAAAEGREFTDDGGLLAFRGTTPAVVPGLVSNWKVTTGADWEKAAARLASGG